MIACGNVSINMISRDSIRSSSSISCYGSRPTTDVFAEASARGPVSPASGDRFADRDSA
jgi:hypothetical protein